MAIAIGKKMNLFADEADLKETIDYVKARKLMKFFLLYAKICYINIKAEA